MSEFGKFEVFKDRKKMWRWRVKARNGEIIAQSQAYTRKASAIRGAEALETVVSLMHIEVVEK